MCRFSQDKRYKKIDALIFRQFPFLYDMADHFRILVNTLFRIACHTYKQFIRYSSEFYSFRQILCFSPWLLIIKICTP